MSDDGLTLPRLERDRVDCGFIPLVDCAPLVVAREMGFAEEESYDLVLHREPSWSSIRDKLALGRLTAAHMLSPMPVAMSMGIGGLPTEIDVLSILSINGDVVAVSPKLAQAIHERGPLPSFSDAEGRGKRLIEATQDQLRIGVPFPFSMHAELLYFWLERLGLKVPQDLDVRTFPPPLMAEAMAAGEIDAFCVGEPWGSLAVEEGVAEILLPSSAIWSRAPEKVLAVRRSWIEEQPELTGKLMRSVWRAARWLGDRQHHPLAAELLARSVYLDVPVEIIERALSGHLTVDSRGTSFSADGFLEFYQGAASFPWRSQAVWIANRLARRMGADRSEAADQARSCFRPDLFRQVIGGLGVDLPSASEKVEGALAEPTYANSLYGEILLGPDQFFDGSQFDPDRE